MTTTFLRRTALIVSLFAIPSLIEADQNWDGDNAVGNFSFADNWFSNTVGGSSGFGFGNGSLHFSFRNNVSQTSLFYDFAGFANTNDIVWDSTFSAGLTLNGNGQGLNFNQRLQNDSSQSQTIGSSMNLSGAKNGAAQIELNPVNGDLTLNGSIFNDNSKPYFVFGNSGKTLAVNTTLGVGSTPANVTFNIAQNSNVTFGAAQTYTGRTTITAGTLLLGASERIADGSPMTLGGGKLNTGGFSETVGALTLSGNSTIDLGSGASILKFAASNSIGWSTNTLSVWNWTGNTTGGGTDQLFFGASNSGLTSDQLNHISFFSGSGTGFLGTGGILSSGEIVPVPEPGAIAVGMGLLGLIAWRERRGAARSRRLPSLATA